MAKRPRMREHEASRTLVKSPPELWEECSDAASLARHLGQFGEIRITRLEPESAVAWEGQAVSGTVRLEPSGWGTRVTLTAAAEGEEGVEEPEAQESEPEPPDPEPAPPDPEPAPPDPEPAPPDPDPAPPDPESTALSSAQWARRARLLGRVTALFRSREAEPAEPPAIEPTQPAIPEATEPVVVEATEPATPQAPAPAEPATPQAPAPAEPPTTDEATPEPPTTDEASPEPPTPEEAPPESDPDGALAAALDSLGQAHHRPFSRR